MIDLFKLNLYGQVLFACACGGMAVIIYFMVV